MAQSFKETAHLKTDLKKLHANWDLIDWGKGKQEKAPEKDKYSEPLSGNDWFIDRLSPYQRERIINEYSKNHTTPDKYNEGSGYQLAAKLDLDIFARGFSRAEEIFYSMKRMTTDVVIHGLEKDILQLKTQLTEANKVAIFYGNPEHWDYYDSVKEGSDIPENPSTPLHSNLTGDFDDEELLDGFGFLCREAYVSGKTAREYLRKNFIPIEGLNSP